MEILAAFLVSLIGTSLAENYVFGDNNDPKTYFAVDRDFIIRQRAIIKAFKHYRCPSQAESDDFYEASQTYNPRQHLREYRNGDRVNSYVMALEAGKLLPRYDPLTFEARPLGELRQLVGILNDAFDKDAKLFFNTLAYLSTRNNVIMLYTAVCQVVSSLRSEGYRVAAPYEAIPQFYTPKDIIFQANEIDLTGTNETKLYISASNSRVSMPEPKMNWYREDPFINAFHFFWHVDFPSWFNQTQFTTKKVRKGELFLNMHHEIVYRYFAERIALGFNAIPEINFSAPLTPGFTGNVMNIDYQDFPVRGWGVMAQDVSKDGVFVGVSSVQGWLNDIKQGINEGYLIATNGTQVSMRNDQGSDVLGSTLEASDDDTVNGRRYGSYHNSAHRLLARVSDPKGDLDLPVGLVIHQETAMMDPIFYQLHFQIDNTGKLQKDFLPPYKKTELCNNGITITKMYVQTLSGNVAQNELQTEFKNFTWDITNSIREVEGKCSKLKGAQVYANTRVLNSKDFKYVIQYSSNKSSRGVVRIFLAPMESFNGNTPSDMESLRWNFFQMDKFPVKINKGNNTITRLSKDNALAATPFVPMETMDERIDAAYYGGDAFFASNFTRHCGWPLNHLLPMGRVEGMHYWMFAMISDFDVDYEGVDFETARKQKAECLCTVVNGPVPDRKPFGFPFDRRIPDTAQFLTGNMFFTDVSIKHV